MDEKFSDLLGKTLANIVTIDNEEMIFTCFDGSAYKLFHAQDCCENVTIDDLCGDLAHLIGMPILIAEEVTSDINSADAKVDTWQESFTWTFYKLATNRGAVTIRWYGESNGYYSESVDFERIA